MCGWGSIPTAMSLYDRINQRAQRMFDGGLVEETRSLLEKYGTAARPLSALGYKQAVALVRGEIDRKTAVQTAQQAHRNYAKRQMTWFRREPDVIWIPGFGDDDQGPERGHPEDYEINPESQGVARASFASFAVSLANLAVKDLSIRNIKHLTAKIAKRSAKTQRR